MNDIYGRPVGVKTATTQSTEQAPTMTVTAIAPLYPALMEWGDERGIKHTSIVFVEPKSRRAYLPKDGENWTAGFRPFTKDINEQALSKWDLVELERQPSTSVPKEDAVEVIP